MSFIIFNLVAIFYIMKPSYATS